MFLLEKSDELYDLFIKDYANGSFRKDDALKKAVIFQALFDPTLLQNGPTWMQFMPNIGEVPVLSPNMPELQVLNNFFQSEYFSINKIQLSVCSPEFYDWFNTGHESTNVNIYICLC